MISRFIGLVFCLVLALFQLSSIPPCICPALQAEDFLQRADGQHGGLLAGERDKAV
jgi:hypothetical protein